MHSLKHIIASIFVRCIVFYSKKDRMQFEGVLFNLALIVCISSAETGATDADGTMATGTADRLFEIHVVNSYGYTEVDKLSDDGTPIKFDRKMKKCCHSYNALCIL